MPTSQHATFTSQQCKQMGNKGRGVSLLYTRPQNQFSTTENPQDFSGEKAKTKGVQSLKRKAQKEAKQGLREGKQPPTQK